MPINFGKTCGSWCVRIPCVGCLILLVSGCGTRPSSITVSASHAVRHKVDLAWEAPASSPIEVVDYHVYRAPAGTSTYQLLNASVVTETVYLDSTVQSGFSYDYMVNSVDSSGVESAPSNQVDVTVP
ncbi:hypothetical protein H7849_14770 [Alloacidobacterium dinghuense]|uniref:Fibronectin type-III domain-containing protein n=1 Tax=Alloacidobacterium dinghuense TaxID=2763107 RepID=A0A7G8BD04_9BACT|nr:hypothetical protein [Alloacidobacterium dinghuense]QNI30424.1 hypothetical protein H7849_14770 [Alloacidobacterium dinghuense]